MYCTPKLAMAAPSAFGRGTSAVAALRPGLPRCIVVRVVPVRTGGLQGDMP